MISSTVPATFLNRAIENIRYWISKCTREYKKRLRQIALHIVTTLQTQKSNMGGESNQFCVRILNFIQAGRCGDKALHHEVYLLTKGVYKILNMDEEAKREQYAEQQNNVMLSSFCINKVKVG